SSLLAAPGAASILLLERPTAGASEAEAHALLTAARRRADAGAAVVVAVDAPEPVAPFATTLALFVAGRLLSWAAPPIALVPAVHILSARREVNAAQAGSIMTSST